MLRSMELVSTAFSVSVTRDLISTILCDTTILAFDFFGLGLTPGSELSAFSPDTLCPCPTRWSPAGCRTRPACRPPREWCCWSCWTSCWCFSLRWGASVLCTCVNLSTFCIHLCTKNCAIFSQITAKRSQPLKVVLPTDALSRSSHQREVVSKSSKYKRVKFYWLFLVDAPETEPVEDCSTAPPTSYVMR